MRFGFKQKLIISFLLIFILYTGGIIYFERQQSKTQKAESLHSRLDDYTNIIHQYISQDSIRDNDYKVIAHLINSLPKELRISIINNDGKVVFDRIINKNNKFDNHLDRIEIIGALYNDFGTNIRKSISTNDEYFYYAKHYTDYYIRVALPYDVHTKSLLKADNHIIYTTLILFVLVILLLFYTANRFNSSILQLKNMTLNIKYGKPIPPNTNFSDDTLGDISKELVEILDQKESARLEVIAEREKLRLHFQYSVEGLAFFKPNNEKIYVNTYFIQFANMLSNEPILNIHNIFNENSFRPILDFLKNKKENTFDTQIEKNGKTFSVRTIVFEDDSFAITIKDITKTEKNRLLKQQMTSNIAHELKTPITALRGYLETMKEQDLTKEKQNDFIEKAYLQSIRLSNLVDDVSLLSKIEEQNKSFEFEAINIASIIDNIRINISDKLLINKAQLISTIDSKIKVQGNYSLLLSAFQNLVDNSLKYAGKGVQIHINCYMEDDSFYYFSFYDTGKGVDESHLNKLFERFYRVSEGRERNSGGSGLGLSIVKNVFILHQGDIQAKSHKDGGLELISKLKKPSPLIPNL